MVLPAYPGRPYPAAQPNRLALVARLFGLEPPPVAGARVLDLGCGAGANLLSIASALPGTSCIGVDFDADVIARGRQLVAEAELGNVKLICADLREIGLPMQTADYVIVHGLWSWVDRDVREAVMRLCATSLAPGGVAMVSYNALPGWFAWLPAQAIARVSRKLEEDPVQAARSTLALARQLHGPGEDLYGRMLGEAAERYERSDPGLLLADDLTGARPWWLEDVVSAAVAEGLQYLGEAIPEQWWQWRVGAAKADRLRNRAGQTPVAQQQFADLASGVDFKASLFVSGSARPSLEPDPARIADAFALSLPTDATLPAVPALLRIDDALREAFPRAVPLRDLEHRCALTAASVAKAGLALVADRRAEIYLEQPEWSIGDEHFPEAPALARVQAGFGREVTSLRHVQVSLDDENARGLLSLMNGSRDRETLSNELRELASVHASVARAGLDEYIQRLAELGLLRSPISRRSVD